MRTRILSEPDLFSKIDDQIKNLLIKGYAKLLSDEIGLKILLKKIWCVNIRWDQELPESLLEDWNQWKLLLSQVATFNIPRCYSPMMSLETQIDRTWTLASLVFRCLLPARVTKRRGGRNAVAAKSKVAPLKPLIPYWAHA